MRSNILLVISAFSCIATALHGADLQEWSIASVTLTADPLDGVGRGEVRAVVHSSSGQDVHVSADVHLTKIGMAFVSSNKLVLLGEAGKTSAVVVFDLLARGLMDWFLCYDPRRVSDDWIAYVEWYPAHATGEPTDVILLYDLTRSPAENRLKPMGNHTLPPAYVDQPIEVGLPIFPEINVRLHSYENRATDVMAAQHILGTPFVLLPSKTLVIAVSLGYDSASSRNHLSVVDLSSGPLQPVSRDIDIPMDKLRRTGANQRLLKIVGMEAVSGHEVRLILPAADYGVNSIVIDTTNNK